MNTFNHVAGRMRRTLVPMVPMVLATGLVVAAAPADARPPVKLGAVSNLVVGAVTHSAGSYAVPTTWDVLSGATSYRVSLATTTGTTLASGTVTAAHWTAKTAQGAGQTVTVKVTAMAGKRAGKTATSASFPLPDVTAPTGTYTVDQATPGAVTVTLSQTALSDDVTPAASIVRTVDWGDRTETWGSGTTLTHTYPTALASYYPSVTLQDAAGNTQTIPLRTVVVEDHAAPTGSFGVTAAAWATYTKVSLSETSLTEDYSALADVRRVVDWNDGTPTATWTGSTAPTHVYAQPGSYAPTVQLLDEAGNAGAATMSNGVVVSADTGRPTVSLTRPARHPRWVRSWVVVHGDASDAGTGVRQVQLQVIEKRGASWYAYRGTTRRWVKGGTTQAAALRKTTLASVTPTASHTWSYRFSGLRKGVLITKVRAVDNVANTSAFRSYKQALTHS